MWHGMNVTLAKALVALVAVCLLVYRSAVSFLRQKSAPSLLQLAGAASLIVVVLTHICEALRLFPWMHWGASTSAGHYLDFSSAVVGVTLFVMGYLLRKRAKRHG